MGTVEPLDLLCSVSFLISYSLPANDSLPDNNPSRKEKKKGTILSIESNFKQHLMYPSLGKGLKLHLVCGKCELSSFYVKLFMSFDNIADDTYSEY